MACDLTQGRAKQCKQSLGGTQELYLFNYVENPFTVVGGEATAINPLLTAVYRYELEGDGNPLEEALASDRNNGTTVNTQTITAVLKKIDASTSAEMNVLAYGFPMAVVKDRNGVYHAVGIQDGIDFSVTQSTGSAKADLNGYTLTGTATTGALSPKLNPATVTAFLNLI
jgi:hypothetical protein